MFILYPSMLADSPTGLSGLPGFLSAAAASHAGEAQNEHLNNDDEEEAPPCQRSRVGTSRHDSMMAEPPLVTQPPASPPLAADDSVCGIESVQEGGDVEELSTQRSY
jgi:hypothetical protein